MDVANQAAALVADVVPVVQEAEGGLDAHGADDDGADDGVVFGFGCIELVGGVSGEVRGGREGSRLTLLID